ncbi:MAG: transglutaminase family protein [Chlamydiota bacterium]
MPRSALKILIFLLPISLLCSPVPSSLSTLYSTLDPTSVSQHFAFYELYPKTLEGRQALKHAWDLLSGGCSDCDPELILPSLDPQPLISFVNRTTHENAPILNEEQLIVIEKLSRHLGNRRLKGFGLWDMEAFLKLPTKEVDLARGLLLAELSQDPGARLKIRSYEANIDLMALQIFARLTPDATPEQKIRAINDYIFSEMRFRFPPHSLYAKEIDVYTFLPSVLDSRRGVCLGVSILYLSLAQRLDLTLEAITPPGHIYVRYAPEGGDLINIETTARGIDVPSETYLGLETRKLQKRTIREVIGLAFMNQAAVSWHKNNPENAILLYEKARPFLEDEFLLNMFLGFNYLFVGKEKEGRALLEKVQGIIPDHGISTDTMTEDYLAGLTDAEAIQTVFAEVDETRNSILEKQKKLEAVVAKYPHFRQGFFHLATTWLQLGREKEALPILEKYIQMHPKDATVNYYLSAIYFQRHNFNQAWKYLQASEELVHGKEHHPKALGDLRGALQRVCPAPLKE